MTHLEPQTTPTIIKRTSRRRPSDRAFEAYRRNVIEQERQEAIASSMRISRGRVANLVRKVIRWANKHETCDVLAVKVQHTQMLYDLYREARQQWRRSYEDATNHSIVSVEGLTGRDGAALPKRTTTRVSRKGQSGNPRYLEICDTLLASIRGIWGADAPKQMDLSTTDEQHVTVVTITDRAAVALAKIDEELSRRGGVLDAECSDDYAGGARGDRGGDANGPSEST